MSMTMLQIMQQAVGEMGSGAVPTYVAGNTQQDTVQQLYLLNGLGQSLSRDFIWQGMTKQYIVTVSFTTLVGSTTINSTTLTVSSTSTIDNTYGVSGAGINQACYVNSIDSPTTLTLSQPATATSSAQTYTFTKVKYAMPTDYDRQIDRTHWDKTKHWEMLGPETAQQWEWLISGYISTGPRIRYRIFGNFFQIWPFVASAETIGFEYISTAWATSAAGVGLSNFAADTDTCQFPNRLMVAGLKHRYFQVKGFGDVFREEYERELQIAFSNDAGSQTLSFAPRVSGILITQANIPDSGYGG
ncbi:hypothetical protein UFOVP1095_41 [uncultured Caudovirales phage]|uniref:Uncharacterized protein n=1 Tax=uncultured Caudovirales phage TaxID=2100421 RepID=A0A6J5QTI4_9CAUD|nr:hypothetical protein UFOVP918_41 [uncultured Caudovirales phage]CAB4182824.1 hypothetical protein UFOVP1095_41 [uncultured Caudovirales phage]CAB4214342.1 hypothetical protein UFOVP1452_41 [uncultured Caudovirales phage]CAB5228337.1 hypothetical protein UFOVP1540_18 [uncultured Caudovirales phage]